MVPNFECRQPCLHQFISQVYGTNFRGNHRLHQFISQGSTSSVGQSSNTSVYLLGSYIECGETIVYISFISHHPPVNLPGVFGYRRMARREYFDGHRMKTRDLQNIWRDMVRLAPGKMSQRVQGEAGVRRVVG